MGRYYDYDEPPEVSEMREYGVFTRAELREARKAEAEALKKREAERIKKRDKS